MSLKSLELSGFKSFAKKGELSFTSPVTAVVGPNGSGKSNVAEAFRFVLGEQSIKSMRGKRTEDLIWNGSDDLARQSRASVKVVFDNSKRLLNMDFDEVSIERIIHRDSLSEYKINGTEVRLKDIAELLAQANIGASGHHIISQGEADRILSANAKERREMIMDALGLRVYQYKREESERKLEKTRENMKEVEGLRREIAPHLKFLKKQVEKVEKTIALREELRNSYKEYLFRENVYLKEQEELIAKESEAPKSRLAELEKTLSKAKGILESSKKEDKGTQALIAVEKRLREARGKKEEASRALGRIEGEIAGLMRAIKSVRSVAGSESKMVALADVKKFLADFDEEIEMVAEEPTPMRIKEFVGKARTWMREFITAHESGEATSHNAPDTQAEIDALQKQKKEIEQNLAHSQKDEKTAQEEYEKVKTSIEGEKDASRDAEREVFRVMAEQNEIRSTLQMISVREEKLAVGLADFKREIEEGGRIIGRDVYAFETYKEISHQDALKEPREKQHERAKAIEKIKIRLEDDGAVSADEVLKEYKETSARDEFLGKELLDLESSAKSLEALISDLGEKLNTLFDEGVHKINTQFKEFFMKMFGGGSSGLKVVEEKKRRRIPVELDEDGSAFAGAMADEEDEEKEIGVEIEVSLPRKKIKGLEMLSGGERALTSIALLFAISQVNPPPFIILDETDAALDEANSKKYGDMLELLSKHSQLIVITHNRETMSRAGVLYGVTMGKDGASKLLSIAFNEALAVAK